MSSEINPILLDLQKELTVDSNYKDPAVFDVDADINQDLLYERDQFKPLARNIMQFLTLGVREHALVIGPKGSGKTAIVKYILNEAKKLDDPIFEQIYINCREYDNSYKIMKGMIGEKKKIPADTVLQTFVDHLNSTGNKTFLILDEIDMVRDDHLLYHITRRNDLNMIHIIMITKTPKFYDRLTPDVKSSLKHETFFFDSYGYYQIKEILEKRAKVGLKEYDPHVLFKIALSNVSNAYGDVRAGIKVLEKLFKSPQYPKSADNDGKKVVSKEIIDQINEMMNMIYQKMKEGVIRSLCETKLEILYYLLKFQASNMAFNNYIKNTMITISKSNFFKNMEEMAYMDLFFVQNIRNGRSNILKIIPQIDNENKGLVVELLKKKSRLLGHEFKELE